MNNVTNCKGLSIEQDNKKTHREKQEMPSNKGNIQVPNPKVVGHKTLQY